VWGFFLFLNHILGKGVGVVLRFIYIFWVWGTWDSGFWRRVFFDFFYCFGGKGWGWLLDFLLFFRIIFTGWGRRAFGTWGEGGLGVVFLIKDSEYICIYIFWV